LVKSQLVSLKSTETPVVLDGSIIESLFSYFSPNVPSGNLT
jgi:hypothetical protein